MLAEKDNEKGLGALEPWSWGGEGPGDLFWAYSDTSRAWYAKSLGDRAGTVNMGLYDKGGGTLGEFTCYWVDLNGQAAFKMEVFADAFKAMAQAPGMMGAIYAGGERWDDKAEFLKFLDGMGVLDLTDVEQASDPLPGAIAKRAAKMLAASLTVELPSGRKRLGYKSI